MSRENLENTESSPRLDRVTAYAIMVCVRIKKGKTAKNWLLPTDVVVAFDAWYDSYINAGGTAYPAKAVAGALVAWMEIPAEEQERWMKKAYAVV